MKSIGEKHIRAMEQQMAMFSKQGTLRSETQGSAHADEPSMVRIHLCSEQWTKDEHPEPVRLSTQGLLGRHDESACWTVSYRESEATGMEGTVTHVSLFDDGSVQLLRQGNYEAELFFRAGNRHVTRLDTPMGAKDLAVITNQVDGRLESDGGQIALAYSLIMPQHEAVSTRLVMDVSPIGKDGLKRNE